jgi:hypothetical protein
VGNASEPAQNAVAARTAVARVGKSVVGQPYPLAQPAFVYLAASDVYSIILAGGPCELEVRSSRLRMPSPTLPACRRGRRRIASQSQTRK